MKYPDCQGPADGCGACSLSNYGRDCRNNPINRFAHFRALCGLSQQQTADLAGISLRHYQKIEYGTINVENITLRNGLALAAALGVDPIDLLE